MILEGMALKKYYPVAGGFRLRKARVWLKAVDGVSAQVETGWTLGIVGESGSGKTTLAKLLLLLEPPTSGALRFDGQDVETFDRADRARYRRAVQAVFQDPYSSLNPRRRIAASIAEPLLPSYGLSQSAVRKRVAELLTLVGISPDSGSLYPHEFSGGQRQRIAIARALAPNPQCIILDEPVSALDASMRAQILNLLQGLQERLGLAYVMITHDLAAARHLSTHLAVMYAGKLVEAGACEAVYATPRHPYTQALLSAALPLHPSAQRPRMILPGEIPNPLALPAGCRFHPRCPQATPACAAIEPAWREVGHGHFAACHLGDAP